MGNKSSKKVNADYAAMAMDSNEEISTKSNEEVNDINPKGKIGFIGNEVLDFEKDVYLPKTGEVGILKKEDLEGVFSVLYFYSGDFDPGVLPEISELKKMTTSPASAGISNYNLLAVSTDSINAHQAFSKLDQTQGGLKGIDIVLVSDQTAELCKMFQIYNESCHSAYPSYIILDPEVKAISKTTFDPKVGGDISYIFNVLKSLLNESTQDDKGGDEKEFSTRVDTTDPYMHMAMATKDNKKNDLNDNTGVDKKMSFEADKIEACTDEACNKNESSVSA